MLNTVTVPEAFKPIFEQAQQHVADYFASMQQNPEQGKITIGDSRYVLIRGAAFSVEFFQLIRKLFGDDLQLQADIFAAGLLYELAHAVGRSDAKNFHQKMQLNDPIAKLSAGPVHFAFSGWAYVDISEHSNPEPNENFCLIYKHPYSFECDAWQHSDETTQNPVCIMNAGYSSGWCQESFGIPLEARELTCQSLGHDDCLFIMAQPHVIEDKISAYVAQHQITRCDQSLAFAHTDDNNEQGLMQVMQQRLMTYARNLEATKAQLTKSEKRWRELSNTSFDAILVCKNQFIASANKASEALFERSIEQLEQSRLADVCPIHFEQILQALEHKHHMLSEFKLHINGHEKFVNVHIHQSLDEPEIIILAIRDITERTLAKLRLERLANFDQLTGLPNRMRFQQIVERILRERDFSHQGALLFVDLDGFKQINDQYGHSAGDYLLFEVAQRMTQATRSSNTICRLGGDEFAIWVPNIEQISDAEHVANQLLKCLDTPINLDHQSLNVTMSIGIAHYPKHGTDYSKLLQMADKAMYQAKDLGKNCYRLYHT